MWTQEKLKYSFEAARSPVQNVRVSGELALDAFAKDCPAFIPMLISFCSDMTMIKYDRHLALVLLNQHVKLSWKSFSKEWQLALATFSFQYSIQEPHLESQIKRLAMALLSKIYGASDQDEMGQIASSLQNFLGSEEESTRLATIRTLCEIAKDVEYFRQMFLLRWCYNTLQSIIEDHTSRISTANISDNSKPDHQYLQQVAYYVTKFMRVCVVTLGEANISCGFEEDEASFILANFIPHWVAKNCSSLNVFVGRPESILGNLAMVIDLCCALSSTLDYFAQDTGVELKSVCALAFSILRTLESHFHLIDITNDHSSGYTSDGDRINVDILVLHLFEIVHAGMTNLRPGDDDAVIDESERETFDDTVRLIASFMTLRGAQIEMWAEEPNEFIHGEYDDVQETNSLRNVCAEVLREICSGSKGAVYVSILNATHTEFVEKEELFQSFLAGALPPRHVSVIIEASKVLETLSWMLGIVGKGYISALIRSRKIISNKRNAEKKVSKKMDRFAAVTAAAPPQDVTRLVQAITAFVLQFPGSISQKYTQSAEFSSNPARISLAILQYRVLWLCGEVSYLFQGQSVFTIAKRCEAIALPGNFLSLRLQACLTLTKILKVPRTYFESLEEARSSESSVDTRSLTLNTDILASSVVELIPHCNDNSIHVPYDLLTSLANTHGKEISKGAFSCIMQISIETLSRSCTDSITVGKVDEALTRLLQACRGETFLDAIHTIYLPFAKSAILSESQSGRLVDAFVVVTIAFLSQIGINLVRCGDLEGTSLCLHDTLEILVTALSVPYLIERYVDCTMRAITSILECLPQQKWEKLPIMQSITLARLVESLLLAVNDELTRQIRQITESTGNCSTRKVNNRGLAASMGLFCHLTINTGHLLGIENFGTATSLAFQITQLIQDNKTKFIFCMAFVNLLARNVSQTLQLLDYNFDVMQSGSRAFFLSLWEQMHTTMDSRYNVFVSCVAILESLSALRAVVGANSMKLKLLEMLLDKLPTILASDTNRHMSSPYARERKGKNVYTTMDNNLGADDDSCFDDEYESSLDTTDFSSDESLLHMDDEEGSNTDEEESPFAPAELYLSDMISSSKTTDISGVGGDDDSYTAALSCGVQEDIMYSQAEKSDPLLQLFDGDDTQIKIALQVRERVVDMFTALRREQHDFDSLIGQLSPEHRSTLESLLII